MHLKPADKIKLPTLNVRHVATDHGKDYTEVGMEA